MAGCEASSPASARPEPSEPNRPVARSARLAMVRVPPSRSTAIWRMVRGETDNQETLLPAGGDIGVDHLGRVDDAIEVGLGDIAELQRGGLERKIVVLGIMRYLRRLVVADHRH